MLTIYGIKNCDTMKKAFTWLDGQGIAYQFHDFDILPALKGKGIYTFFRYLCCKWGGSIFAMSYSCSG